MVANRQDAWTPDDDLLLAEVTLRHIREGGTQLAAFEEVAERLGRTSAACGFRWNSMVRKNYESAIALAKTQRQKMKVTKMNSSKNDPVDYTITSFQNHVTSTDPTEGLEFEAVIQFVYTQKSQVIELRKKVKELEHQLQEKEGELRRLRDENLRMKNDYFSAKTVNEDYRALLQIMERARKLAAFNDEEDKSVFKMDSNGNLERVNK